jgi:hypothetical protein
MCLEIGDGLVDQGLLVTVEHLVSHRGHERTYLSVAARPEILQLLQNVGRV